MFFCISFPLISIYATPYMMVATAAYFIFLSGLMFVGVNKNTHAMLMSSAMLMDLILVLTLEIQRNAIETLISFKLTPLNKVHIYSSTIAVVLYFPVFYLGYKKLSGKGTKSINKWHKILGKFTVLFRTIGFLFMFSMLK
ncbi:hypothetical protein N9W41_00750 [bacterium]|nr:hypothetical protein [bacterium]